MNSSRDLKRKTKQAEYSAAWRARNPEKSRASQVAYREKHRELRNARQRLRRSKNLTKMAEAMRKWRAKRREHYSEYRRRRYRLNINGCRDTKQAWNKKNRAKAVGYDRKRYAIRRLQPTYLILCSLRSRLNAILRRSRSKSTTLSKLLGCSFEDFKIYLESKFEPGMSWENHGQGVGKWHVDHIMPCAIFDLSKPEHQRRCFHFSNMQPLWWIDNIRKSDQILTNQFNLL